MAVEDIPALVAEVERLRHQLSHVEVDRDHYKNQSAEVERLRGRIEALHPREVIAVHEGYGEEAMCVTCERHYPCPSIIALGGP